MVPASTLPVVTKQNGGKIIEVNLTETQLSPLADLTLVGNSSEVMPALVDQVRKVVGS